MMTRCYITFLLLITIAFTSISQAAEMLVPYELPRDKSEITIDTLNFKWFFTNLKANHLYSVRVNSQILTNNTNYEFQTFLNDAQSTEI